MKQLVARIRQSPFLQYNALLFGGSAVVGLLNYLYYPILGRLLQPNEFGEVQALVSIFLQLSIFLIVFGIITVNIIATYRDQIQAKRTIFELEKLALLISTVIFAVVLLTQEQLRSAFQFSSPWPFSALALALVASVPLAFRGAYLRGVKLFGQASMVQVIGAASKLVLSVLFVLLGASTLGAIGGLVAAQLIALGYAVKMARRHGFKPAGTYRTLPHLPSVLPELRFAALVCLSSLVMTLLVSIDAILIKYWFDPHTAGLYAGIATVARVIFFLTLSISQVLLPLVSLQHAARQNQSVLYKSLALTVAVSLPVLLVCMWWPEWLTTLLMGKQYISLAALLPLLAATIFLLSIGNLFVSYHMALRRRGVAWVVLTCAIIGFVLMVKHHATPQNIVENLFVSSSSLLILLGIWLLLRFVRRHRE